jgi:hypothetical protein
MVCGILTEALAITGPEASAGDSWTIQIQQAASGGYAVTWSGITWISGAPSMPTAANTYMTVILWCVDGSTVFGAVVGQLGASGVPGVAGASGVPGSTGPVGAPGVPGACGVAGACGVPGSSTWLPVVGIYTVSAGAVTVGDGYPSVVVTNDSATTAAIDIQNASAIDGQQLVLRFYDYSDVTVRLSWGGNTENGAATMPTDSNGSTTSPLTVAWIYNGVTNKWRCMAAG